jgi:hypothetical protein
MKKAIAILEVVGMPQEGGYISLARGEALGLPSLAGRSVSCFVGAIWLTQAGKPEDIVLGAGERHVVEGRGRVVISALEGGQIRID